MKAYLTTIGENTTDLVKQELERFGFEVVVLAGKEKWIQKYQRFINEANEDCIRIDADVIPNKRIKEFAEMFLKSDFLMGQAQVFDLYTNDLFATSPVFYSKEVLAILKNNFWKLNSEMPETSAWRLPEINGATFTHRYVVGMHGFFQGKPDWKRGLRHKAMKHQIDQADVERFNTLINL